MVLRDGFRTEVIAAAGASGLRVIAGEMGVWIFNRLAVNENLLSADFDGISNHCDHPFDKIL